MAVQIVSVDTEFKYFDDAKIPDPPQLYVWDIAVVGLTEQLEVDNNNVFHTLIKRPKREVCKEKRPTKRATVLEWKQARKGKSKRFQELLHRALDGKIWIGWNLKGTDLRHIKGLFTKIDPPRPHNIFDVYIWANQKMHKNKGASQGLKLSSVFKKLSLNFGCTDQEIIDTIYECGHLEFQEEDMVGDLGIDFSCGPVRSGPAEAKFSIAVVQIYVDSDGDLELAAKAVESSKLKFSRYGDIFFEVLFAGTYTDTGTALPHDKPSHPFYLLNCKPTRDAILQYAFYIGNILNQKPFLRKNLENVLQRFLHSLELIHEMGRKNLAIFTALAISQELLGFPPETIFHHVPKRVAFSFAADFFKEYVVDGNLEDLVEHNEKMVKLKVVKSALTTQISSEADENAVIQAVKHHVQEAELSDEEVVCILWDVIMDSVQWSGTNQQKNSNAALRQVKAWATLLIKFCKNFKLQLELIYKVQLQCHEDPKLMKLFPEIVKHLYGKHVLEETTILHFYKNSNRKGRETFVKSLEQFVKCLDADA